MVFPCHVLYLVHFLGSIFAPKVMGLFVFICSILDLRELVDSEFTIEFFCGKSYLKKNVS